MRMILPAVCFAASVAFAQPNDVSRAIADLGSREFAVREAATDRLNALGAAALPALQESLAIGNPESNRRAEALIAKIRQRLADEAALAPKMVKFQRSPAKLGDIFDDFRRQTTYEFRLSGDSTLLAKEFEFDTGGEVPLWEAVAKVCEAAGLAVESVSAAHGPTNPAPVNVPRPTLSGEETILKEFREKKLLDLEVRQTVLLAQQRQLNAEIAKANARDRVAFTKDLTAVEAELKDTTRKIATLKDILSGKTKLPSPTGTIVLGVRSLAKPSPSTFAGAIRIEVVADPVAKNRSNGGVPVALKFQPEPGVRWVSVAEIVATKAVDSEGREWKHNHAPRPALPPDVSSTFKRQSGSYSGQTTLVPPYEGVLELLPPEGPAVKTITRLEGLVRANVWTKSEAILTVRGLTTEGSIEDSLHDAAMSATLVPNPANKLSPYLDVSIAYHTARVRPAPSTPENAMWLAPGAKGEAIRVKGADALPAPARNAYGLSLTDAEGRSYVLNVNRSETTQYGNSDLTLNFAAKYRFTLRPAATGEIGPPAVLSFHGTRIRTVTFPFTLTDVP